MQAVTREIPSFPRSLEEAHPEYVVAFDAEFRKEGGRSTQHDALLQWYRLRYWHYIKVFRDSALHSPYLSRFHFDLVASDHLNAAATRYDGGKGIKPIYLIGLNVGTILNLEAFFCLLFSHPKVLPDIGQPSKETSWLASLSGCDWGLPWKSALRGVMFRGEPPSDFPIDDVRKVYAHRLAILATDFVFFHELGHLANGHIEYLNAKRRGPRVIERAHGQLSAADALDSQALELNADSHAVSVMTPEWLLMPEKLPPTSAFETITEAVESLALAVIAVFLLFDPHPTRVSQYGRMAHPHPAVRLVNVGLMTWSAAERAGHESLKKVQAAWLCGLQRAEAMCRVLEVATSVWSAVAKEMNSVKAEHKRIATHFQTVDRSLRLDLRRHNT